MKKFNYALVALVASSTFCIGGCSTVQQASSAMGSTGTGVLAGVLSGAGTGILCDKLTGGKDTALCATAGVLVGAAVGTWAASMDDALQKSVPTMDCVSVKRSMNYPSTSTQPIARLKFTTPPPQVVKPGQDLIIPVKMDLATPGATGSEQEITIKTNIISGNDSLPLGRPITRVCGGDYSWNWKIPTDSNKEGVYNTTFKLVDAANGQQIQGGILTFCYTVANDGINKCGQPSAQVVSERIYRI